MNMKKYLVALALGISAVSVHAASPDPAEKQKRDEAFAQMDTNKDGVIDRKEFDASLDSIATALEAQVGEGFKELDLNGDEKLDRDEVKPNAALAGYFDQIDTDKDGFLSLDEIKNALKAAQTDEPAR
jgi:Ca2+-binding EF-hand superfamily protein